MRGSSSLLGRLVDMGGHQVLGLDADLVEERQAARRSGSEDEFGAGCHASPLAQIRLFVNRSDETRETLADALSAAISRSVR